MNKTYWGVLVAVLIVASGTSYVYKENIYESMGLYENATTTPVVVIPPVKNIAPYGEVTLRIGETVTFAQNSIKLVRVFDESRCPQGVTCIWAGTVKAEVISVTGMGTSTETIELGKTLTTEAEQITLVSVTPYPKEGQTITQGEYKLTFKVVLRKETVVTPTQGKCYVGGCSSQVCSDTPGMASTCEYRAEYGCYKNTSTCERQSDGKCGWTQTVALKSCLANPPAL